MRALLSIATALVLSASSALAHDYRAGSLDIRHPWARATPKGAAVAGAYMTIVNKGATADRLVGGTADFAGRFEIHEMSMEGGIMRMRHLPRGLEIAPGQTVELKSGSFHVMFMGLRRPLEPGQRVKGTLVFEKAGTVEIEYAVEAIGAAPDGHHGH